MPSTEDPNEKKGVWIPFFCYSEHFLPKVSSAEEYLAEDKKKKEEAPKEIPVAGLLDAH